jgi:hypothetical protein
LEPEANSAFLRQLLLFAAIPLVVALAIYGRPSRATETAGKVVVSEIEEVFWDSAASSGPQMNMEPDYQPAIEIAYSVRDLDYRQRMEVPGASDTRVQVNVPGLATIKGAARQKAEALLAAYPVARQVQVSYDPHNPAAVTLAGIAPMLPSSGWFGRTVLPPIAIAAVFAWGTWAFGAF